MPCTTLLIGKHASFDGSTIVARNEDSYNGEFTPKRFCVVRPDEQPRHYTSVLSHFTLELPDEPLRYTALPNARLDEGLWAAAGINDANVAMSATETLSVSPRMLAADPLVPYVPAKGRPGEPGFEPGHVGGIGEEDMVTLVLPYIRSAREGVLRLGHLLEELGTYENNGIAFHDADEIWWLETIGGHHWIAKRVPDDAYVVAPNQQGIDYLDLTDALGEGAENLCSADLIAFVDEHNLDLALDRTTGPRILDCRRAFGSASDADHIYNTPRAWAIQRFLSPGACVWDGPAAELTPTSDDIPWSRVAERRYTIEDVKYALSLHYQNTPYDPYGRAGVPDQRGIFRPVGINRTSQLSATQIRGDLPAEYAAVQWVAFASNAHNALVPQLVHVDTVPDYLSYTPETVTTESFYWTCRLIAAMADASWNMCLPHLERYQRRLVTECTRLVDACVRDQTDREQTNQRIADVVRRETDELMGKVLFERSMQMRNRFSRSDT